MALYRGQNFAPYKNYIIAASNVSADQAITQAANSGNAVAKDLLVYNNTAVVAFIGWGMSTVTADNTYVAVAPGAIMMFDMGGPMTHVAAILASSTGNIYISVGTGT